MERNIGEAAGAVWRVLHSNGPMSQKQVYRSTGLASDVANQGIGWLAREGKVVLTQSRKGHRTVRLKG